MISHEQAAVRRQNVIAVLLVGSAILLGGGGSPAPFPELALQLEESGYKGVKEQHAVTVAARFLPP